MNKFNLEEYRNEKINAPSTNIFLQKWLFNFLLGWPLVFLSIILIGPPVTRFVNLIVE